MNRGKLTWRLFAVTEGMLCLAIWFEWRLRNVDTTSDWGSGLVFSEVLFVVGAQAFAIVGIMIALRLPSNPIGWLCLAVAFFWYLPLGAYAQYGLETGAVPGAELAAALTGWTWIPPIGITGIFLPLLFPDGRLPSSRWRWVARIAVVGMALVAILITVAPGDLADSGFPGLDNPLGIEALRPFIDILLPVLLIIPLSIVAGAVALVGRYRRSRGPERLQMKWLATAAAWVGAIYAVVMALTLPLSEQAVPPGWLLLLQDVAVSSFFLIPVAIGFAVLRYRLYDIDVVISKALVFGTLAVLITGLYIAIVVGLGAVVGSGDEPDAALSIAATVLVALVFQPVRGRVQRLANRLVYGARATPYEVIAELGRKMSGAVDVDRTLPQLAEVAAGGVGATEGRVRLFLPKGERVTTWPDDAAALDPPTSSIEVTYQGGTIGEIAVWKPSSASLTPAETSLLADLAGQAGLVLHNVRLTEELEARAAELTLQAAALRASRERLVTARDAQRRGLERDIREGPTRALEEIGHALEALQDRSDPGAKSATLEALGERSNATLEVLRDLARGIFPPLLADKGIVAALEAHIRKVGAKAVVHGDPEIRFHAEVEACVYFCCVQAIQNVVRHAGNAPTDVRISTAGDLLTFEIRDEGPGFDPTLTPDGMGVPIMRDRVGALEGELLIESTPGAGTRVRGRVPAPTLEVVST